MSILTDLVQGLDEGRTEYEQAMWDVRENMESSYGFQVVENHSFNAAAAESGCKLVCADNMEYMKYLLANGYAGKIKAIYIDPPFFTKASYNATVSIPSASDGRKQTIHHLAYNDKFERSLEYYIANMTSRLMLMRELLHTEGLIWVHLDWHSAHYVKVLLDEIFGEKNFINEIVWKYKSGGSGKRHFARKHDTILVYSRSNHYKLNVPTEKSYNRGLKPYRFKGVTEYCDEYGWYTLVNMKDVWAIDMVGRTSAERTGYATQKPLELMRRIIEASTDEGDLVADFFCGSGSFLEAAQQTGRIWMGCDNEQLAASFARRRPGMCEADYVFMSNRDELKRVGRVTLSLVQKETLENGKSLFHYEITGFDADIDVGHIPLKERALVRETNEYDSRSLIDYVMIDPDYRGVFSAEIILTDNTNQLKFISGGNAAVVVVDIFGREYFAKMEE